MPDVPLHEALGAGLRWLGGGKGKALKNLKKAYQEPDSVESSMELHQMAQAMGLESVSEDENIDNHTYKSGRHREKGKHDPSSDTSIPVGPSRSGSTIDYSKTDGYQRSIWQKDRGYSSYSDKLPAHDSPRVTIGYTEHGSEYPSAKLGLSGKPWGQQSPPAHSTPENYILPYRTIGNLQVGSPRGSNWVPAELPTPANNPPENEIPAVGSVRKSNNHQHTKQQGPLQSNQPSSSPVIFDPVRDAAARNLAGSVIHTNSKQHTSSHAVLARKPVLPSPYQQPPIGKGVENSKSHQKAERARINRQNEEEILQERRERKLKDSPPENQKPHDIHIDEAAKNRRRNEEEILQERRGRKLKESRKANQQANTQLPPPLPPKIPLSFNARPDPSTKPSTSPDSIPIPLPLFPPTSNFIPHNSFPGPINFPPYPQTHTSRSSRHKAISSSSSLFKNSPESPTHPLTPANYHLNGYNNQNDIQRRAFHHAIKYEMLHGDKRMANPTPPTFRIEYPAARELDGTSVYVEIGHDSTRERIPEINIGGKKIGERMDIDVRAPGAPRRYAFADKKNLGTGIFGPRLIRGKEGERTGGGTLGAGRMDLNGENRRREGTDDRRVKGEKKVPEIHVQSPTPGTSLRVQRDVNVNTDRTKTRMNEQTDHLAVPVLGMGTEHANGRRRYKHGHRHHRKDVKSTQEDL
ncbi:hypothetical protein OCU04_011319 [Sclerotinia nivalis]|uniref:Uncharacterized protein n=1 Tax=Sclerotinia nivalis TaxID=352851 RepID=A0A9X0DEL8_9HELO|nr:hypothetical protein OCU04_011319 [Sclerotinia nivalis]